MMIKNLSSRRIFELWLVAITLICAWDLPEILKAIK